MLDKTFESIKFLMENTYTSTNAVGFALVDAGGNMLGECGDVDLPMIAESVSLICARSRELYTFLNGINDDEICLFSEGTRGRFAIYSVSKSVFMVMLFPKTVDIFRIKENLDKTASKMRELFNTMSAGRGSCRL